MGPQPNFVTQNDRQEKAQKDAWHAVAMAAVEVLSGKNIWRFKYHQNNQLSQH